MCLSQSTVFLSSQSSMIFKSSTAAALFALVLPLTEN